MRNLLMVAVLAAVPFQTVYAANGVPPTRARTESQIFVVNFGTGDWQLADGTVGEFTTSGATINARLISGLSRPMAIAVSGNYLFISELGGEGPGRIAKYTTSGTLVNASLIRGLGVPLGIAIYGDHLFVVNWPFSTSANPSPINTVGEYTLSGETVNASLIGGSVGIGVATDGNYLYVSTWAGGTVGKYTMSGAAVNPSLISGLRYPGGLALDGTGNLYVSTINHVGKYTTSGGIINASLISNGYNSATGLALDGRGNLFWANNSDDIIGKYTTSGQVENAYFITTGLHNPCGIAIMVPDDITPPAISVAANPKVLWPPNGAMVPVTVTGRITDDEPDGSGVDPSTAAYAVIDDYGQVEPAGPIQLQPDGTYSFVILLQASREADDPEGREYIITVTAQDRAGNTGSAATSVIVPHDRGGSRRPPYLY